MKSHEKRYRRMVENTTELVWEIDEKGIFTYINPRAKTIYGLQPKEILGKTPFDLMPADQSGRCADFFKAAGNSEKSFFRINSTARKINGDEIFLETTGFPFFDDHGKLLGYNGTSVNITEKKLLKSRLQQARKIEAIGTLAAGIVHDFNNILMAIIGFATISLVHNKNNSHLEDNLRKILAVSERAKDLVNQILTFARQADEKLEPVDMRIIANQAIKFIGSSLPDSIKIRSHIHNDSQVMGNAIQLQQVLMNLLTNAVHAMAEIGGIIELSLNDIEINNFSQIEELGLKPGKYLKISVSDTGTGIAPEILKSIFDPYFTTKETGKGTGMGLAIVNGIVDAYNGKIIVESILGQYTIFIIYLPIFEVIKPACPYPEKEPSSSLSPSWSMNGEIPA